MAEHGRCEPVDFEAFLERQAAHLRTRDANAARRRAIELQAAHLSPQMSPTSRRLAARARKPRLHVRVPPLM